MGSTLAQHATLLKGDHSGTYAPLASPAFTGSPAAPKFTIAGPTGNASGYHLLFQNTDGASDGTQEMKIRVLTQTQSGSPGGRFSFERENGDALFQVTGDPSSVQAAGAGILGNFIIRVTQLNFNCQGDPACMFSLDSHGNQYPNQPGSGVAAYSPAKISHRSSMIDSSGTTTPRDWREYGLLDVGATLDTSRIKRLTDYYDNATLVARIRATPPYPSDSDPELLIDYPTTPRVVLQGPATGVVLRPSSASRPAMQVWTHAASGANDQTADLFRVCAWDGTTPTVVSRITKSGRFATTVSAAPADADMNNSEVGLWVDLTSGYERLAQKVKKADGTTVNNGLAVLGANPGPITFDYYSSPAVTARAFAANITPAAVAYYKARGTYASPASVANGDNIAEMQMYGYDASGTPAAVLAGRIRLACEATVAAGAVPTRMQFWTMDTSGNLTEFMRGDSSQRTSIGGTAPSTTAQLTVDAANISGRRGLVVRATANATKGDIASFETVANTIGSRIGYGGRFMTRVASAPALADMVDGEIALSVDASGNLVVTSRVSGALKTGTVTVA